MSTSTPLIELANVHFSYGETPLLDSISMSVSRGEIVALMGGSGSGKTTLLKLISGQLSQQSGSIKFQGEEVTSQTHKQRLAMRKQMGMLFQFGALFTDLSVFENIAFPLREHFQLSEQTIRDLVLMKLHAVGLRGAANLMPHELSGGMARRVALARAIALDPLVMLYDEPFTGLDPISLSIIADLIKELNDALGTGSILVTHNIPESLKIVDKVYFMSSGKIVGQGTPDEILNSTDPYVHQFIHAEPDGPVAFHKPAPSYTADLGLGEQP
ncbi:ABC transporter ATP-binding protein [Leeia sp. TBRC 13508]|uniref:ABC transporter ATP-binding protein n=1 Tax=Leeia speluncae TaxID=2884804 RepID=A0ABS8D7Q6_9NEIS|nr:ABC transporter ATP-binding protein [Leeia speluncae]MCB6183678.1 ABC transporter ATP-binding protein [Leeia speluncae]